MNRSYIVAFTIFPKNYGKFKTKFKVFSDYKGAYNFYKSLMTENKCFYQQIFKEELNNKELKENHDIIDMYDNIVE